MLPSNIRSQMERKVDEKLDSLEKYLPFINYLLEMNSEKYIKFTDIKQWIMSRKRYPMHVLQKIEQSIITQYRNLFYEEVKVSKYIMEIFNTDSSKVKCFRVNLCSDDEEDNGDNDDDVIIVSTSVQPEKAKLPESDNTVPCAMNTDHESVTSTSEQIDILETICLDSGDDDDDKKEDDEHKNDLCCEEKLFKRRKDFKGESHESLVVSQIFERRAAVEIDEAIEISEESETIQIDDGSEVAVIDERNEAQEEKVDGLEAEKTNETMTETNLENLDIEKLQQIYEQLSNENGIDIRQLLDEVDLLPLLRNENKRKGILQNSDTDFTPHYENFCVPQTRIITNEMQNHDMPYNNPPVTHPPVTLPPVTLPPVTLPRVTLPPQPFKLNLKDPRIIRLLERNKKLPPFCSTGVSNDSGGGKLIAPNNNPTTYGEYKRLKAAKEKKAAEAKRAEEARMAEEKRKAEEVRRVDEERRAKEVRRSEEAIRAEEARRAEEEMRAKEARKAEEERREKEAIRRSEEANKAEQVRKVEDEMRAALEKKIEEALKAEETKRLRLENKLEREKAMVKRSTNELSRANTVDETNQSSEISSSSTFPKEIHTQLQNQTDSFVDPQTDLRSIILNTILPYGDKILDVLRRENTLKELGETVTILNTVEQHDAEVRTKSISLAANQRRLSENSAEEKTQAKNGADKQIVEIPAYIPKVEETDTKASRNLKRQRKNIVIPSYKRIRTISTSSSASSSSSTTTSPSRVKETSPVLIREPVIKLRRLSPETILKYTSMSSSGKSSPSSTVSDRSKTINIQLVEDVSRTNKMHAVVESKPAKLNVKYKNIDILMTSKNTTFCTLCKSKPSDLTNHYRRVHKTESYVARLNRSTLSTLETNIPFAQLICTATNSNIKKYLLKCAFCQNKIEEKFTNFYKHFSTHTGEYAFQCGICKLEKPFEFDIQSHKCHSKSCRNGRLNTLYQYPPNVLVIYLYCCKICNFVQLNEANTFKHLRDHHDKRQDDSSLIRKYIIAAVNDEETCDTPAEPEANFDFLEKDEDILVRNEAIVEDMPEVFAKIEHGELEFELLRNRETVAANDKAIKSSICMVEQPTTSYICNEKLNKDALSEKVLTTQTAQRDDKRVLPLSSMENLVSIGDACSIEYIKTESPDVLPAQQKENCVNKKPLFNTSHTVYRQYPHGISYFGLFKCMATDCLYSTDASDEILQHLNEHRRSEWPPVGYLLCAYCQLDAEICNTPEMLIEHIKKYHQHAPYQCSVCCYRATSPNHVLMHSNFSHPEQQDTLVYKCVLDVALDNSVPTNVSELFRENVEPLVCSFKDCFSSFHSLIWMQNHLTNVHSEPINSACIVGLEKYACIYCPWKCRDIEDVRNHLVASHPDQPTYVCERILMGKEDSLQNQAVTFVSLPDVPDEKIKQVNIKHDILLPKNEVPEFESLTALETLESLIAEFNETDDGPNQCENETKPNVEQLEKAAEESLRHCLLKLTGSTGVPHNLLYHCPLPTCGGFFSSYDLWYRHMNIRHCCIISVCPHCPNEKKKELPLVDFKEHFQQHCCHLYGCYYCGETFANELATSEHIKLSHADINPEAFALRIEKVPLYFNQPFAVLMKSSQNDEEIKDRYCLLLELQEIVQKRCKYVEQLYNDSIKTQWTVPVTTSWLENFPSFKNNESVKRKCFCTNCPFQTFDNEVLYDHLRAYHRIGGNRFICAKCDYRVSCQDWEPIIEHIKMHLLNIHICCVCSYYHHDRYKLLEHLRHEHRFRDVPIVTIIRSPESVQMTIAIVFAELRKTFSTVKNCFFCPEDRGNTWEIYAKHLKKAHFVALQYFCEICRKPLKLTACDEHFNTNHPTSALRIRCQFATNNQLYIETIKPLKLQIESSPYAPNLLKRPHIVETYNKTIVKQEPCDNDSESDVEIINEDDIVIANDTRMSEEQQNNKVIRCVKLTNLQNQASEMQVVAQPQLVTQIQSIPQYIPQTIIQPQHIPQIPSFPQSQQRQLIPQFLSPTSSNTLNATTSDTALFSPRMAIQSPNMNFSSNCNVRPVTIYIRPNSTNMTTMDTQGTPRDTNYNFST